MDSIGFEDFDLDARNYRLRRSGQDVKLERIPLELLLLLADRAGEVVTREEIVERLWGKGVQLDTENAINTAIRKIRLALDDDPAHPRFVQTVTGKGYRFIAPVTQAGPVSSEAPIAAAGDAVAAANSTPASSVGPFGVGPETFRGTLLAAPHELPQAPRILVRTLLLLIQAMYLAFYLGALANLSEILDIFADAHLLSPATLTALLVATAVAMIPVRLFFFAAVAFDFQQLPSKFRKLFPVLLGMDLLWALSPFLLVHHVSLGLALGMTAALVYMPFAQRSLVLMYARSR